MSGPYDALRRRVRARMQRDGIPIGTDNPALIDAGAFPWPRRFQLQRTEDETGVSGVGAVAWGVEFPDGVCVTRWSVTDIRQTCVWRSLADIEAIHGHNGKTRVIWLDTHPAPERT